MTHPEIFKTLYKDICKEPVVTDNKVIAKNSEIALIVDKYVLPEEFTSSFKEIAKFSLCPNGCFKGYYTREKLIKFLEKYYSDKIDIVLKVFDTVNCRECNCYTCTYQGTTRIKLLFTEYLYLII